MIVLLDTHVAIWLAMADAALGKKARQLIDTAATDGALAISAVSFWEIAMLIEKGRLQTTLPADEIRNSLLQAGIAEIPLAGDIALLSVELSLHSDPADRFIAASAITHSATLMTADRHLLKWKHPVKRVDARR